MGKKCLGAPSGEACVFGPFAGPATPKPGNWHCSWCDPKLLEAVLAKPNGKARMKQLCANFSDKIKKRALCKLPKKMHKEFQQKKEAEAETPEKTTEAPRKKKKRLLLAIENSHPMMTNPSRTTAAGMLTSSDLASTSERLNRAGSS